MDQNQQYMADVEPSVRAEMQAQLAAQAQASDYLNIQMDTARQAQGYLSSQIDVSNKASTYLDTQISNANKAADQSKYLWDRYTNQLVPVQDQLINYAKSQAPGTPAGTAYANQQAAAAKADVATSMDAARVAAEENARSHGVDPSMGRGGALDRAQAIAQAAAMSAAGTQSRIQSDTRGLALLGAVNDMAQGAPGQVAQALSMTGPLGTAGFNAANTSGTAGFNAANTSGIGGFNVANSTGVAGVNAGLSGASTQSNLSPAGTLGGLALNPYINALGPFGSSASGLGSTGANFFGQGTAAIGQAGNLMNTGFSNQMASYNAQQAQSQNFFGGLGQLVGGGLGFALGGPMGAMAGAKIGGGASGFG
jgi:hypothetical protein